MAEEDDGAPAFVKELFFREIRDRLPAKLIEIQQRYAARWGDDVSLPMPDMVRTQPERFPESEKTLVLFAEETEFREVRVDDHGSVAGEVSEGQGTYASGVRVDYYCRGAVPVAGLREVEVLNIQCQNTLWAARKTVIDIGNLVHYEGEYGLRMVEVGKLQFDNTRGRRFPLTEWGMFRFIPFVG